MMRFLSMSMIFCLCTALTHGSASSSEDELSLPLHSSSIPSSSKNMSTQGESLIFSHEKNGTILSEDLKNIPAIREIIFNNTRIGGLEHLNACPDIKKVVFTGEQTLPKITFLSKEDLPPSLNLLILMENQLSEFHLVSAPPQLYVLSLENVFDALSVPSHVSFLGAIINGDVFQNDSDWGRIASISNVTVKDDAWKDDILASSLTFQNPSQYLQNLGITENTTFDFINGKIQVHNLIEGYMKEPIITRIQNAQLALPLLPL